MNKIREVVAYKHYFEEFLNAQTTKVQDKIYKIIEAMETKSWKTIKDEVYGKKGTSRRDQLERETKGLKIGLLLRQAREQKHLTQKELGELVDKKRTYISRVENDGSNLTLKTLYEIVEKGLGGKVTISIDI